MNAPLNQSFTESDLLLEQMGCGLIAVHGSTLIRVSALMADMLGSPPTALIGKDLSQLFSTQPQQLIKDWIGSIYEGKAVQGLSAQEQAGRARHFTLFHTPLHGASSYTRAIVVRPEVQAAHGGHDEHDDVGAKNLRRMLKELLDGNPVPTFVINAEHVIMHWNLACTTVIGRSAAEMVGTRNQWQPFYESPRSLLADLVVDGLDFDAATRQYGSELRRSDMLPDGLECTEFFPGLGKSGRWLLHTAAPIRSQGGKITGAIETLIDITELKSVEQALRNSHDALEDLVSTRTQELSLAKKALEKDIERRERAEDSLLKRYAELTEMNVRLEEARQELEAAHKQLVQNEKLASIGQLAAGVAHEINNPIGYVFSNFGTLETYISDMLELIDAYCKAEPQISDQTMREQLCALRERLDLEFLQSDSQALMRESREGIERVRKIVQDLKDFSHVDSSDEWQLADLHRGLESTLNIVRNELKYHASIVKEFGQLPQIECCASQLNQVFMNLLVNAGHALEGRENARITLRTDCNDQEIWVEVEDNGCGMSEETLNKIFDPFFTTKPIGVGTGLGLSLSYGIVQKHGGRIEVRSEPDKGTTFKVVLPIKHTTVETTA